MDTTHKPPAFPMPPKSALFGRLEAFLPQMASENKKLEDAIASGEGDRHNIEIPEPDDNEADHESEGEEENSDVEMDEENNKPKKAPVIEMNFALGLMEEGGSESDSSDDVNETEEIDLAASIAAARSQPMETDDGKGLQLPTDKPTASSTKRPLIQELN